jgi:predicted deacetylase
MAARYLIRLDDASEYMHHEKWAPFFALLDAYAIKPIVAVIPCNRDPNMVHGAPDADFWAKVRQWQAKGYHIALHGFEHRYRTRESGIIGGNRRSEFAGVPLDEQVAMLSSAYAKFKEEGVTAGIFVAPAHTFDRNTLQALARATPIRILSDGFYMNALRKGEFHWIPQQLWSPRPKSRGLWTICYHPETAGGAQVEELAAFLKIHADQMVDPGSLAFGTMRTEDRWFNAAVRCRRALATLARRTLGMTRA